MWSIRNLKDHDVSYATAILRQVIKTIVSKGLLYFTGGAVYNSIDNWNNNAQCLLVDAHGDRPITKAAGSAAGSADALGLSADAYGTQPINGPLARAVCWMESTVVGWQDGECHGGASKIRGYRSRWLVPIGWLIGWVPYASANNQVNHIDNNLNTCFVLKERGREGERERGRGGKKERGAEGNTERYSEKGR